MLQSDGVTSNDKNKEDHERRSFRVGGAVYEICIGVDASLQSVAKVAVNTMALLKECVSCSVLSYKHCTPDGVNVKHGGDWYYWLSPGDKFDLRSRTAQTGFQICCSEVTGYCPIVNIVS